VSVISVVLVACGPGPSQSAAPGSAVKSSSVFTSELYGYTAMLPGSWTSLQAAATWNGTSPASPGHDATNVDQFTAPPRDSNLWAYAAPTKLTLAKYVTQTLDAAAAEHPCSEGSQKPENNEAIVVGGEPARLITIHCGILVLLAITIHDGVGAVFGFQDPSGDLSLDTEDRGAFMSFLNGIRFVK
jgi:hypothetical protein